MHSQKTRIGVVAVISLIMAALRIFLISAYIEKNSFAVDTYYLPDKPEITAFTVVSALFLILFLYLGYSSGKKKLVNLGHSHIGVSAASILLAFALIGASLFYSVQLFSDGSEFKLAEFAVFVLTLLSAVVFLVSGLQFNKPRKSESFYATAALVPIFFSALRILSDFISTSSAPLASSGAYHIISLVAVLLYFLAEGKSYVVEVSAASHSAFGFVSLLFLLVYAIPDLVLRCSGSLPFNLSAAFSLVDVCIAIYIAVRLATTKIEKKQ